MLCLSTSYADCIIAATLTLSQVPTLPQHVLRGLHRRKDDRNRLPRRALPQHVLRGLHPHGKSSLFQTPSLPQHVLRGLHRQKRTR